MGKLKLVPATFDPKQADIKETTGEDLEESDESTREREYAGRIENASERFRTPVFQTKEEEEEQNADSTVPVPVAVSNRNRD
jgi:hypothetical protein